MADKRLIKVPLTELRTFDAEVAGSLYPHKGKIYRWVKNAGSTALQRSAACLTLPTSAREAIGSRVVAPSGSGPLTPASANILMAAGVPLAAIGPSGSDTGDYGWILAKGVDSVAMANSETQADQQVGCFAIASVALDNAWGPPLDPGTTPSTITPTKIASKRVVIAKAYTTVSTAASFVTAIVDVQCL